MPLTTLGTSDSNLRNIAVKDTDCSYLEGGTLLAAADEANTILLYFYNDSLVQKLVGFRDNLGALITIKSVRRQCYCFKSALNIFLNYFFLSLIHSFNKHLLLLIRTIYR